MNEVYLILFTVCKYLQSDFIHLTILIAHEMNIIKSQILFCVKFLWGNMLNLEYDIQNFLTDWTLFFLYKFFQISDYVRISSAHFVFEI
jgi:hypothetical protein